MPHVDLSLTELPAAERAASRAATPPGTRASAVVPVQPSRRAATHRGQPEHRQPEHPAPPGAAIEAQPVPRPLRHWAATVAGAAEPCLLIDAEAVIVAMSPSCRRLLGLSGPETGRALLDGVLRLLDFSAAAAALTDNEVGKIPPLLALSSGRLARGLIRLQCGPTACTLDAVATPIGDGGGVAGSLTFFSTI